MVARLQRRVLWVCVIPLLFIPPTALAQTEALPAVPKFEIAPSPIGLRGDVRPRQYVGVVGRKAAWLGGAQKSLHRSSAENGTGRGFGFKRK